MNYLDKARAAAKRLSSPAAAPTPENLDDTLRQIFRAAVREIEEVLFHEMLGHINRKHPDAWAEILEAEEDVEDAWKQAEAGTIPLEKFRSTVTRWRDLHLGLAQEHAASTCQECPPERAGACRAAWRARDRWAAGQQPTVWTEPPPGCRRNPQ